jgi:hypothetical protein
MTKNNRERDARDEKKKATHRQVQQFLERFVQQSSWNASGFREEHRHEPERYARGSANQVPDILFRPRRSLEE